MAVIKTENNSPIPLSYDPAERRRVEAAIAGAELRVTVLERRATISSDPGDYYLLSDAIHLLVTLYTRRCFFLVADIRRAEACMIAVSDSSGEVVEQPSSSDQCQDEDDDWETLADDEVAMANLSMSSMPASNVGEIAAPVRRKGRGSFLYRTNELYSDQVDEVGDAGGNSLLEESGSVRNQQYGTGHVILLYDFPSTTRLTALESLFESFRERGVAIRRVSYTVALAVFRTPSAAQEAQTGIEFPFKVRRLEEGDIELHKIPQEDLEPPSARPRTSSRTAQRMIGHAMGMEAGSSAGGGRSEEFKRQEAARKDRLHRRHDLKDAAWGPDE